MKTKVIKDVEIKVPAELRLRLRICNGAYEIVNVKFHMPEDLVIEVTEDIVAKEEII